MQLRLTDDEVAVLRQVLEVYLIQLRDEVSNTDAYELRQALKRNEEVIKDLMRRVGSEVKAGV
jgi:hypothetical protein